ncbi:MAG: DUF2971 domain-containing protein [Bacteroidaceae bacterium]
MIVGRLPEDFELFLNMPETLYVLRMNADGTNVAVEEHKLKLYPGFDRLLNQLLEWKQVGKTSDKMVHDRPIKARDLRVWGFGELVEDTQYSESMGVTYPLKKMDDDLCVTLAVRHDISMDTLKSRVMARRVSDTLRAMDDERIGGYSVRRDEIERIFVTARKTLSKFNQNIDEAWELLHAYGEENIRREKSLDNIDLCSPSYTLYVYEKPFLKMVYRLGNRSRTDEWFTEYDVPCWKFEYFQYGGICVYQRKTPIEKGKSFVEWMDYICKEPDDASVQRVVIIEQIKNTYGFSITKEDIMYDPAASCYLLSEATERRLLGGLMPELARKTDWIAKYTTFEGLVAILESGKIRMNSIVSMNDKTETDFLKEVIRNYKEDYECDYDKYLFADKEFITSFTTRIDDLDMWRLYGDNARGVCMVFWRNPNADDKLYKINYIDPGKEDLTKAYDLMEAMEKKGIRFRLDVMQKYRHYLKHVDYKNEDEYRLLTQSDDPDGWFINRDNGILTPYVAKPLRKTGPIEADDYPFRLRRIILGPAMKEKQVNVEQVFYLIHQYGYYLSVEESGIDSYR